MSTKSRPLVAVLVLALVSAVLALGGCTAAKSGSAKQVLATDLIEPTAIDPYNIVDTEGAEVVSSVFDSLVEFDSKTSKVKPAVASEWKSNADATVWTFTLRKGVKFHNDREVQAEDFKYAWERIANPKTDPPSEISYHLASIAGYDEMQNGEATELAGVKVKDAYTLEVTLSYPFADFVYITGHPALAPVPKEEVEKDPKKFSEKPIGNGPFMMAEPWQHEKSIKLKRFNDYYGTKAKLDELTFKIYKDTVTAFLDFKAGKLDFQKAIPTEQIQASVKTYGKSADGFEATDKGQVLLGGEIGVYYLTLNNGNEVLKNADVRRAISLAINREAIIENVFAGTRVSATGMVPPGVVGYREDAGKYSRYDKEEAAKLLEKAGFPGGKDLPKIKLVVNPGADHEKVMQYVQADLKAVGIETELQTLEPAAIGPMLGKGEHEIVRMGWTYDYPVMDSALYSLFYSENIGMDNTSQYSNPEVDKLLVEARQETDEKERIAKYQKAEGMILEDSAVVPLNFYSHRAVVQEWVKGLVYGPLGLTDYTGAYIEK
ncbi:MAG: peptide ABC transporter substrate-binding protein [Candidatus Aquicultorales bacterium]